jgi:hypothetical protein
MAVVKLCAPAGLAKKKTLRKKDSKECLMYLLGWL